MRCSKGKNEKIMINLEQNKNYKDGLYTQCRSWKQYYNGSLVKL